ncbi:MAG: DNA polymerase III subunit delta' [bacterium]
MGFENIIGQRQVKLFFEKALRNQRMSHAYLFVGERGVGKEAMALEVAKSLFCSNRTPFPCGQCADCHRIARIAHPDLLYVYPAPLKVNEGDHQKIIASLQTDPYQRLELWANPSISIERIRQIRQASAFKSLEGKGRIVILVDAERMTIEAANALLKILEEPPEGTYLLLISSKPNLIVPTIASRCQPVNFDPLAAEEIESALIQRNGVAATQARLVARLSSGSYRQAIELLDEDLQSLREEALEFFRKSVQNDFTQLLFVEEVLHRVQRDSKRVKDLLGALLFWFRDAMIYRESHGEKCENLVNFDQVEVLQKFVANFPHADLYGAVQEVEKSMELMQRNVQLNLILIVLLNKLRARIKETRDAY